LPTAYSYPDDLSISLISKLPCFAGLAVLDYVYIAFDDGSIYAAAITSSNIIKLALFAKTSSDIGPGFAVIEKDDLFFVGGNLTDGGFYSFDRQFYNQGCRIQQLYSFRNWAPVFDCQVIKSQDKSNDQLFIASGYKENGSIARVRYGIDASVTAQGPRLDG
ncbi:mono-functional DNA-alkylating methyl methanesulfonate N-term-domain-containing protein, partial [Lipomyces oligophaga]|uniref:mono-functional DNA-alkylating methyl methanesulfonate N-term-domain-containing protein n=1 Tax=Lipomyces oligophaga TaxID=45792 RepID=UPI0034CDDB12